VSPPNGVGTSRTDSGNADKQGNHPTGNLNGCGSGRRQIAVRIHDAQVPRQAIDRLA
jgi:hypothetical protein